ncbi:CoA transferase [Salinadaptatus halalkaliphilus]|uniref:CoA transferase n=1 Tax=Salinadaptatus halalkaliphilus TaxID=2419781 RepID=A0A4S3TSG1_9EURY|nr:CoA transferase [Salinadaptatus halalkaliphilus]THE66323.1 CoA transferase [Salinadaptatus halalkaliphilus]
MPTTGTGDETALPLSDITVVDLTQVIAGPFASMQLGDLGATVIKLEAVGRGDRSRSLQPSPAYFDSINRNKRSVAVDLKSEEGQEVAQTLLADADVFIESTKPGRAESYGLGYETVSALNPELVYCSISGFGRDSPYEEMPAWDMLVQGMSGIMSITGTEDGPPLWSGLPVGDLIAGSYAVQSVLAALYARENGEIDGEWVEVPMFDAAISWLTARAGHSFGTDEPFPRLGTRHPSIAPFGVFECADDSIVVPAGTDSLWNGFCRALEAPELLADERFETLDDRVANREALLAEVEPIFDSRPAAEWLERLRDEGVPAGPINDTRSVWDDEHVEHRQLRQSMPRENRQDAEVVDSPVHFSELTTTLEVPPQRLGGSTDDVLSEYGYDDDEIERLRNDDIVE